MSVVGNKELLQSAHDATGSKKVCQRIPLLVDEGSFQGLDTRTKSADHSAEAVTDLGYVGGLPVHVFAQDNEVGGGAMSKTQAYKIRKLYDPALKTGTPAVEIYDSVGGHLEEETELLAAYGDTLLKSNNLSGVVPQTSVVLGPYIGTSALIAASADFTIMAENATSTIETADENSSAKATSKLGLAYWVEKTEEDTLDRARKVLCRPPSNNPFLVPGTDTLGACSNSELQEGAKVTDIINAVAGDDSCMEFYPEHGTFAITSLALINGASVGVIGYQDIVGSHCCSKATRFVRFCDTFSLPIVTIMDADKFTSLRGAAKLSAACSEATAIKVTIVSDRAVGTFYIAAADRGANADATMAWTNAAVSPVSPATAALFQSSDQPAGSESPIEQRKQLIEDYKATQVSPFTAAADGYVEDIILPGGARQKLVSHLEILAGKRVSTLPKKHSSVPV